MAERPEAHREGHPASADALAERHRAAALAERHREASLAERHRGARRERHPERREVRREAQPVLQGPEPRQDRERPVLFYPQAKT